MQHYFPWMGIALAFVCWFPAAHADERDFNGIVTHVFDGDSFTVLPSGAPPARENEIEVRLLDIDAPEKDQPHADRARLALIKLVEGRDVFIDVVDIDRYERKVAKVRRMPDSLDIARALVHEGHASVNRKYTKDHALIRIEDTARSKRIGLWSLPSAERVAPWEFRRRNGHKARKEHKN